MQIVIPMSGFGERFRRAGYQLPKPLIDIDGKPIIAHVLDMFPGEQQVYFICNQEHLDEPAYAMRETLQRLCPSGVVVGIPPHKLGPVHAVRQIEHLLDPHQPVVVNYCDFTCYWDWGHFKSFVKASDCDGAVPAYKGFHPHSLGSTNYAYMRERDGWMLDIQEKQPFTDQRMDEYASSGTYYFKSAEVMAHAFEVTINQGLNVGGEHYVSLAYKPMLAAGKAVAVYPLQHFMQWGTPEDVAEYRQWSDTFLSLCRKPRAETPPMHAWTIVPMAGLGQRFAREGYTRTKPLIPVSGLPMAVQAIRDLPLTTDQVFVMRADMPEWTEVAGELTRQYPRAKVHMLEQVTEGQACTALAGLEVAMASQDQQTKDLPVTFGTCDTGMVYDEPTLQGLMHDDGVDLIVWVTRGQANALRHPHMFGWVDAAEDGAVRAVSVKRPLQSPATDPVITGTFTFKKMSVAREIIRALIDRGERVNGEFYLDSCVNLAVQRGLRCHVLEVRHHLCWGTPNELRTFEYWQSCFHKWHGHPYRLADDVRVPASAIQALEARYARMIPALPTGRS